MMPDKKITYRLLMRLNDHHNESSSTKETESPEAQREDQVEPDEPTRR
jgi:hypothetical protein